MTLINLLHLQRVLALPYVTAETIKQLPKLPGLYYVVANKRVLYVGLAGEKRSHLYARWCSYDPHKMMIHVQQGARLHYQVVRKRKSLRYREAVDIQCFDPPYNVHRPNPKQYVRIDWLAVAYCLIGFVFIFVMMQG